jgi:hypothetical protein
VDILGIFWEELELEETPGVIEDRVDVDHQRLMNTCEHSLKDKAFPRTISRNHGTEPKY